jgi:hypothetical protein
MSIDYRDRWICCDSEQIAIRGYYFPWGTKRIPYVRIRRVQRVNMGALTGRGRIWGTANPRVWAHLDPARPRKRVALILDLGARVSPLITPEDPQRVMDAIHAHTGPGAFAGPPRPRPGRRRARRGLMRRH